MKRVGLSSFAVGVFDFIRNSFGFPMKQKALRAGCDWCTDEEEAAFVVMWICLYTNDWVYIPDMEE